MYGAKGQRGSNEEKENAPVEDRRKLSTELLSGHLSVRGTPSCFDRLSTNGGNLEIAEGMPPSKELGHRRPKGAEVFQVLANHIVNLPVVDFPIHVD